LTALITFIACEGKISSPVITIGPGFGRAWESESKSVCLWLSDDRRSVVAESNCDDAAFTARSLPGNYTGGDDCAITFRYTESIPIRNGRFSIANYQPESEGSTYSIEAIFTSSSTAAGTVTEVNRYGVTCSSAFEAGAYLSTITGP
jgi:hypothetical protein